MSKFISHAHDAGFISGMLSVAVLPIFHGDEKTKAQALAPLWRSLIPAVRAELARDTMLPDEIRAALREPDDAPGSPQ